MQLYAFLPFFLGLFTISFVILLRIMNEKPYNLITILLVINTGILLSYPFLTLEDLVPYLDTILFYHTILTLILFILLFTLVFKNGLFSKNHYHLFIKSIKATKWNAYYVIDHKGRIKEMSESLVTELGFTIEQIKGRNFFEVLNKSIRITHFDNVETNNRAMETFYDEYVKNVKPKANDEHELLFQNYKGESILLHTVEQPIFILGRYRGRINIGEKRSDFDLLGVEKELSQVENELESLRLKFIATLELSSEGLFYIDLDERYIWGSDQFVKMTGMSSNTTDLDDFRKWIYPDDLQTYLTHISGLTTRKQSYKTTYRFLKNGHYVWATEAGKRVFDDKNSNVIMGSFNLMESSSFSKIGQTDVDMLENEESLFVHLDQMVDKNKVYQLVLFDLYNLPAVNDKYGRNIGNMMMNEYIKKVKTTFMSESSKLFRVSGLTFALTIVDPRKMDILRTGVLANKEYMNLTMNYGAIQTELEVMIGVASNESGKQIYTHAKEALGVAKNPNFQANACYYKDLHGQK